jgi:hypothetical protein
MPKFLAGWHYHEEDISWHLEKKYRILAGPNWWQQVCNRSNREKTGRSWEGADFSWLSSKVSRTLMVASHRHLIKSLLGGQRVKEDRTRLPLNARRILWYGHYLVPCHHVYWLCPRAELRFVVFFAHPWVCPQMNVKTRWLMWMKLSI